MTRFTYAPTFIGLTAALLLGLTGCEVSECVTEDGEEATCATSLTRYGLPAVEEPAPIVQPWSSGQNLVVRGIYGQIEIVEGSSDQVVVTFDPFNYRAHDKETEARVELDTKLFHELTLNGNDIEVTTSRQDSKNGLGADIEVAIPPEFDGILDVRNFGAGPVNPGDVSIMAVGASPHINVENDAGLGNCTILGQPTVKLTRVACEDDTAVFDVSDTVAIKVDGDVDLRMASVSPDALSSKVIAEDGSIIANFPPTDAFAVRANASGGSIDLGRLPAACTIIASPEGSETVACNGGGPLFELSALSSFDDQSVSLQWR